MLPSTRLQSCTSSKTQRLLRGGQFKFPQTASSVFSPFLQMQAVKRSQCVRALQHGATVDSSTHTSPSPELSPPLPLPQPDLKVIGIGSRGISAMKRLQSVHGDAELWAIDSDPRLLSSCRGIDQIEVQPSDDSVLSPRDLARLCAPSSGPTEEAGTSQNGVAFVLGSSLGSPGGSSLVRLPFPTQAPLQPLPS